MNVWLFQTGLPALGSKYCHKGNNPNAMSAFQVNKQA